MTKKVSGQGTGQASQQPAPPNETDRTDTLRALNVQRALFRLTNKGPAPSDAPVDGSPEGE